MNAPDTLFQSTLRNVVFAALGPALIMLQVGSMVFFFSEILFQGQHKMPIHWIFGLFVFAIVLISRISIEEGFERAALFGVLLLAAVTMVSGIGAHTLVLAAAWWAASKLTWDCTFVDSSRDVTGQGLVKAAESRWWRWLVTIGWLPPPRREPKVDGAMHESASEPEVFARHDGSRQQEVESPPSAERQIQSQLKRILWERRSKNTPGLWAFYFFVAGLPIFALGQWFVRSDSAAKNYCIRLFAIYLFAGLALMMLTSLIGLTRYAHSRQATLSDAVARGWLLWGTGVAAAVVLVVMLFPWPTTGFSLSRFMPRFETRERTGKSPLAERGRVEGQQGRGPNDPRGAPGQTGGPPSSQEGAGGTPGGQQQGKQPTGTPGRESGGANPGGSGKRPASQGQANQASPNASKSPPTPSKPSPNSPGQRDPSAENAAKSASEKTPSNKSEPAGNSPSSPSPKQPSNSAANRNNSNPEKNRGQTSQGNSATKSPDQASSSSRSTQTPRDSKDAANPQSSQAQSPASNSPGILAAILAFLGSMLRWLLLIAVVLAGLIAAFVYRQPIIAALRSFLASLAAWWNGLFQHESASAEPALAASPRDAWRRFTSFRDPFAQPGEATPAQVVQESFSALEAFAREFGLRREPRETPLEFAGRVRRRFPVLQNESQLLADLYSRLAYSGESLAPAAIAPLRTMWPKLREIFQRAQEQPHDATATV